MEFHEKLQELRKRRGLTQEELAEALYVSRTAVSKWEQGRGYPNLESLKDISKIFSVTIDELLSGDVLLSIAEKDHKEKMRRTYDLLFGLTDLFALALIVLPLYPETVDGYIYSVNLLAYNEISSRNLLVYWGMFLLMIGFGVIKLFLLPFRPEKNTRLLSDFSTGLSIAALLFFSLAREAYAAALMVVMLTVKIILLLKYLKTEP